MTLADIRALLDKITPENWIADRVQSTKHFEFIVYEAASPRIVRLLLRALEQLHSEYDKTCEFAHMPVRPLEYFFPEDE